MRKLLIKSAKISRYHYLLAAAVIIVIVFLFSLYSEQQYIGANVNTEASIVQGDSLSGILEPEAEVKSVFGSLNNFPLINNGSLGNSKRENNYK